MSALPKLPYARGNRFQNNGARRRTHGLGKATWSQKGAQINFGLDIGKFRPSVRWDDSGPPESESSEGSTWQRQMRLRRRRSQNEQKKTKSARARWRSEKGFYAAFLQRPHCLPLIGAFYVYWKKVVKSVDGSGGSERGKHKAHRTPWISSTVGNWKICFRFKWFSFAGDKLHFTIRWL